MKDKIYKTTQANYTTNINTHKLSKKTIFNSIFAQQKNLLQKSNQNKSTNLANRKNASTISLENFTPTVQSPYFYCHQTGKQNNDINHEILAYNKAFLQKNNEDFDRLIKTLTLYIYLNQNVYITNFSIDNGTFNGTHINIHLKDKNVSLKISEASHEAKELILSNYQILKKRLLDHEINLKSLKFID
jgi:hypothetical protein